MVQNRREQRFIQLYPSNHFIYFILIRHQFHSFLFHFFPALSPKWITFFLALVDQYFSGAWITFFLTIATLTFILFILIVYSFHSCHHYFHHSPCYFHHSPRASGDLPLPPACFQNRRSGWERQQILPLLPVWPES